MLCVCPVFSAPLLDSKSNSFLNRPLWWANYYNRLFEAIDCSIWWFCSYNSCSVNFKFGVSSSWSPTFLIFMLDLYWASFSKLFLDSFSFCNIDSLLLLGFEDSDFLIIFVSYDWFYLKADLRSLTLELRFPNKVVPVPEFDSVARSWLPVTLKLTGLLLGYISIEIFIYLAGSIICELLARILVSECVLLIYFDVKFLWLLI